MASLNLRSMITSTIRSTAPQVTLRFMVVSEHSAGVAYCSTPNYNDRCMWRPEMVLVAYSVHATGRSMSPKSIRPSKATSWRVSGATCLPVHRGMTWRVVMQGSVLLGMLLSF